MEAAVVDSLTGLNNRRYLDSHLAAMVGQAAAAGRPLSLMALDIDHFKRVNDTWGHAAGDDVLRGFAARVKSAIRGVDLMCRLGGEEFVVVMPDTAQDVALRVAERVRAIVEATPFVIEDGRRPVAVTVSVGLAERGRDADASAMLRRADEALYRAKAEGRNRVRADAA
jgi:two-component system cell cycle response regulator